MTLRALALVLALILFGSLHVHAQRAVGEWELLGQKTVSFGHEVDTINVNRSQDYFDQRAYRRLRFVAERGEVELRSIRLIYINGYREDQQIGRNLRAGQALVVALPGERSYIAQIVMSYKSRFSISLDRSGLRMQQGLIKVYGENIRARPPAARPQPSLAGFEVLDAQRFDRRTDRVTLAGGAGPRVSEIALRVQGRPIVLDTVRVRFANGASQVVRLGVRLRDGETTQRIDLDGGHRRIEQVSVQLLPRRRGGDARLQLLAKRSPELPRVDGYVQLNAKTFDRRQNRVQFRVGRGDGRLARLRLRSAGEPVVISAVRIRFGNGQTQSISGDMRLGYGQVSPPIDLSGRARFVDAVSIDLDPRRRPGRAELQLFGKAGATAPPFADFSVVSSQRFNRRRDRVGLPVTGRSAWFRQLKLRSDGAAVFVEEVRVVFRSGATQVVYPEVRLRRGETSHPIDLHGRRSPVARVVVYLRPRTRPGQAQLTLLGIKR